MAVAPKFDINDIVLADDMFLYLEQDNKVLAFATNVNLDITADEIDCTNKTSGQWKIGLAGKAGYQLSSDALFTQKEGLTSYDALMTIMLTRKAVDFAIGRAADRENFALDTSKSYYKGKATITSLNLTAGTNDVCQCSVQMTGAGAIELVAGGGGA